MSSEAKAIGGIVAGLLCAILIGLWAVPNYRVWEQGRAGEAKLREAESSRQVLVQEAKSKEEAAKHLAAAEVARARGVTEANRIIGEGLKGHHEYLIYLWIHAMSENSRKEVVYVPTEAGLPILEAGRFRQPVKGPQGK